MFGRVRRVLDCVLLVRVRQMSVMSGLLVVASLMMLRRLAVMVRCHAVMVGCLAVFVHCLL